MNYKRSEADSCLYHKWTKYGLVLWLSWIDDCFFTGPEKACQEAKTQMMQRFDCDEIGNMDEYIGCKLERNWENRSLKWTQPVMIQSFSDEYKTNTSRPSPTTPAEPGQILC